MLEFGKAVKEEKVDLSSSEPFKFYLQVISKTLDLPIVAFFETIQALTSSFITLLGRTNVNCLHLRNLTVFSSFLKSFTSNIVASIVAKNFDTFKDLF